MPKPKLTPEDQMLKDFCETGPVEGQFIPQVRVGRVLAQQIETSDSVKGSESSYHKIIDAVCVLSKSHDVRMISGGDLLRGPVTRRLSSDWRNNRSLFHNETIALVEAKSGKLDHSAVGQVLVYRSLFEHDHPSAKIKQLWIVAGEDDPFIQPACEELGIKVWINNRVTKA